MDMITLAMAKAYTNSQRLAYTEKPVYTFNGDTTGREMTELYGMQFVLLDRKYTDPETIERITASVGGLVIEANKSMLTIESKTTMGITMQTVFAAYRGDDIPIIVIYKGEASEDSSFCVIADSAVNAYVTRVEFAETIVPIDQKYLPGVCLPVVELTTEFLLDGSEVALTEAESKNMDKAAKTSLPIVVSGMLAGGKVMYVFSATSLPDGTTVYNALIMNITLIITNESGAWVMRVESV